MVYAASLFAQATPEAQVLRVLPDLCPVHRDIIRVWVLHLRRDKLIRILRSTPIIPTSYSLSGTPGYTGPPGPTGSPGLQAVQDQAGL